MAAVNSGSASPRRAHHRQLYTLSQQFKENLHLLVDRQLREVIWERRITSRAHVRRLSCRTTVQPCSHSRSLNKSAGRVQLPDDIQHLAVLNPQDGDKAERLRLWEVVSPTTCPPPNKARDAHG